MNREILSPLIIGSTLVFMLLVSCAAPPATATHTLIPPAVSRTAIPTTPTRTSIPVTPTPTGIPATPTRTPLPPPISLEFPTGSFFHQHSPSSFCVLQFNKDGTWVYFWLVPSTDVKDHQPYATGTYSIDGVLYTETSTDHPDCHGPATYAWSYDGNTLAFQVVGEDECTERQETYETWRNYKKVSSSSLP